MGRPDRTYRNVEPEMWDSDDFRALSAPKPNAQTLWQYLLTGKRTIAIPGVAVARPAVMADDLRWPRRAFDRCLLEITTRGMAVADLEAGVVMLTKALIVDGRVRNTSKPTSPGTVKAWAAAILRLPRCALSDEIEARCGRVMSSIGPGFASLFAEAMVGSCTDAAPIHAPSGTDSIAPRTPLPIAGNREQRTENTDRGTGTPDLSLGARAAPATPAPEPRAFAPLAPLVALAVELLNAARAELDPNARPIAADQGDEMALAHHVRGMSPADAEAAVRHGVAAIAAAVRDGREPMDKLRPGELLGPKSWRRWQAATLAPARARGDPSARRTGPAPPAASHGTGPIDPNSL